MTLEEAIDHCEEVAKENEKDFRLCPYPSQECNGSQDCRCLENGSGKGCLKCAAEHRQFAEWLRELNELRKRNAFGTNVGDMIYRQAAIDVLRTCYDTEAITYTNGNKYISYDQALDLFDELPSAQPQYEELTPEEAASEIASGSTMSAWYWLDDMTRLKQMGYAICRKRL